MISKSLRPFFIKQCNRHNARSAFYKRTRLMYISEQLLYSFGLRIVIYKKILPIYSANSLLFYSLYHKLLSKSIFSSICESGFLWDNTTNVSTCLV